jgi:hypothetical protein
MRKNLSKIVMMLLLVIISVELIAACGSGGGKYSKFSNKYVLEGKANVTSYTMLESVDALKELVDLKKDFLLYLGDPECSACSLFTPIYTQFAIENHVKVYYIKPSSALKNARIFDYQYTPSLIPFQQGEAKIVVDPKDDSTPFENAAKLKEFVSHFFTMPTLLEVTEEELDTMIAEDKKFIIYYFWKLCSDCSALKENVMTQYQIDHQDAYNFYFIEVDQYRNPEFGGATGELWKGFAAKYEFDFYRGGKVPTFQYRHGSEIIETAVYYNDTIEAVMDGTNVKGYKVTGSYWEDATFIGNTYDTYQLLLADITPFHNQKIIDFLNRNLKLVA